MLLKRSLLLNKSLILLVNNKGSKVIYNMTFCDIEKTSYELRVASYELLVTS